MTRRGPYENADSKSSPRAVLIAASGAVLVLYYLLLKFVPVPGLGAGRLDSFGNLPAYIDRAVFGTRHLWAYGTTTGMGVTYDPEGILSTLPAIATLLIGIVAGEGIRKHHAGKKKLVSLLMAGGMLLVAGWLLQPFMPINKRLWTSTFVLVSSGVSLLVFALLYGVVDLRRSRWWTWPALVFGTNAIFAFVLSSVITTLTDRIPIASGGGSLTLHRWAYQHLFATWLVPVHASLAYAITIVLLNLVVIWPLHRKRIFLRF
jgi:predicted acyltransferase